MKQTIDKIKNRKGGQKITVLTAYDFLFAKILDEAGIDIVLVGDSVGMVLLGYENTLPVTMEDMLHHTRAVCRGVHRALIVADMPYGSFSTPELALRNGKLFMQAGADAVKIEGAESVQGQIEILIQNKIPVMGHAGMLPQTAALKNGFKVQGKTTEDAERILKESRFLDALGVFSMVLECVPSDLGEKITQAVQVPTIGIGAGPGTDGQVLVLHDMLGFEGRVSPKFVRHFASLGVEVRKAVHHYKLAVTSGDFPSEKESF